MDVLAISEAHASTTEGDAAPREVVEEANAGVVENKFQKAIAAWRSRCLSSNHVGTLADFIGIDLSSLMPQLDATASELITQQKDALVERKELAQRTKEIRKLEDAAKLVEYKSLLKCA